MSKYLITFIFINIISTAYFITHDDEICLIDDLNNNSQVLLKFRFVSDKEFFVKILLKDEKGKILNKYESKNERNKHLAYTHKRKENLYICLIADVEVKTEYSISVGMKNDEIPNVAKSSDIQEINNKIFEEINNIKTIVSRSEAMLDKEENIYEENLNTNKVLNRLCIIEIVLILFMACTQYFIIKKYLNKNQFIN